MDCFTQNVYHLEVKIYFILQVIYRLDYEHIDQILTSMEENFGEPDDDGGNQYLLCNLNPVKTACHMMYMLNIIQSRYSMTSRRTDSLTDDVNKQC